jgi:dTMP kinase
MQRTDTGNRTAATIGRLIVFEGGEGSGKTTQLRHTQQWLYTSGWLPQLQAKGYLSTLLTTREPGGTDLGRQIRRLLLEPTPEPMHPRTELLLYAADRAQHVEQCLYPALRQGALILCDRYIDSTVTYQGYGRGLDLSLIATLNQIASAGLQPDLTIWLDLDVATGLARAQARGQHDRIEQDELVFHEAVRRGFQALAAEHPDRIVRVDARLDEPMVANSVSSILHSTLTRWYGALLD